jgi:hypothetical protein
LQLGSGLYTNVEELNQPENKFGSLLFTGFLIIYGVLLIYTADKINIAEDEIYTLNTSSYNFLKIIHQSYYFEYQPPFYFLVLSWWRTISTGIFFTKLFSIFCTGISAYFLYKTVVQLSSKKISKWMVVIFLLNPFTVWAALEIRLYAFLMMLSISATHYFFRFYFEKNKKTLLVFAIICLFGIYTQYFFSFLIIAFGVIVMISKDRQSFFRYLAFLLPVVIFSFPNLMFVSVGVSGQQIKINSFPFSMIHKIIYTPRDLMLSINDVPGVWLNRIVRLMIYIPIAIAFIIHYIKHNEKRKEIIKNYNLILISLIIMIVLYCVGFAITEVGYEMKYQTVAFPLIIFIFMILWIYPSIIRNFIFGYIALYFSILLIVQYRHPVKTYDYKSVANFLESNKEDNEPIFIYRAVLAMPFKYYFHPKNELIPMPHPVNFNSNYRFSIKDTCQFRNTLLPHLKISKSFYFISDTTKYEGLLKMNRDMISNYLDNHYQKSLDTFLLGNGKERCLRIRKYEIINK